MPNMTQGLKHDDIIYSTSTSDSSLPDESTGLLPLQEGSDSVTSLATATSTIMSSSTLQSARRLLYVSHFFNQFSECTWQFCLVLFLAAFSNYQSLILVTSYGLVSYSFVCAFGSTAGRFVDCANRLQVARQFIGFENCAVVLATILCYMLLSKKELLQSSTEVQKESLSDWKGIPTDPSSVLLLVGIHLLGSIAALLDSGFRVAVERDWIVVMSSCSIHLASGNPSLEDELAAQKVWLSDTNVNMRQIDLSCKVAAPAVAGFFIAFFDDGSGRDHGYDLRGAALLVGGLNAISLAVEWICTRKIYYDIPDLALKAEKSNDEDATLVESHTKSGGNNTEVCVQGRGRRCLGMTIPNGLEVYFSQPICWAGVSLALLYLNVVLTFGGIMTAYLVWRGMNMETIGTWRGVSSAAGLAGTFVYHLMAKTTDLVNIGMVSVVLQFLCLTSCYVSLYVDNDSISYALLIAGVCFSRIGLWVFDIAVTQLMQEHVPAPIRGLVGGVQQSLNAFFTLVAYSVGLFISDPKDFYIYASTAYAGVALAALFYARNVYVKKSTLFPTKFDDLQN
ncbi:ferroportin1 FPN1 [Nitzschia inconspicua]|uniref:Solute carrier family 40 member n=1 Tax=Nitzschia inconspicua TaxID=303405 RepID=A0A9K3L7J4_9STRA|nr:ferroportin1 FPN1 [Nitzschia inconspicua]